MKGWMIVIFLPSLALCDTTTIRKGRNLTEYQDASWGNKKRATITVHDQNYKDVDGQWKAVEEDFFDDGADGFDVKADRMNHRIRVKGTTERRWYPRRNVDTEYVEIGPIEAWIANQWRSPSPGAMNRFMNTMYWENNTARIELIPLWNMMKWNFVLKTAQCPNRIRFLDSFVGLSNSGGVLTSNASGEVVGYIIKPTAVDSTGASVTVTTITYNGYLEMIVDTSGGHFPITVDPTYAIQMDAGGIATHVLQISDFNFGTNTQIRWRRQALNNENGLVKFDLSGMEANATIVSSTISFWTASALGAQSLSIHSILSANSAWTETGAKWTSTNGTGYWAGDTGHDGGADAGCMVSGTDYNASAMATATNPTSADAEMKMTCDVSMVQAWYNGANYGLVTVGQATGHPMHSDNAATAAYRPKIDIEYTVPDAGSRFKSIGTWNINGGATIK